MISRNFLKSSLIYTLAGALPTASAIILLPFYIHHLSTENFGAFSIFLAFSVLIQVIVTFSFDSSVYIHFHELKNEKEKLSSFISSAFIAIILIGLAVSLFFIVAGDLLFRMTLSEKSISFFPYGLAAVVTGVFQAAFKVHSTLLQSREKPEIFFWSNVLSFSLIAAFTIIGLQLFPNTLTGPILGRLCASVISSSRALVMIFREFGVCFDFSWLRSSFSFNLYTFIYQLQQWIINYFDRILMLFFLTLQDVGVYDFAIKCLIPVELLLNSLHSSFYPKVVSGIMAQTDKSSTQEINRYYHGLTAVIMLLVCGSILIFPLAIETLVSKKAYHEAIDYIPYVAVIYLFRTMRSFFAVPYGILKYTHPLPVIYLAISALKIALVILLIDHFNIYGVIAASLVSAMTEITLLKRNLKNKFKFKFNTFKIILAPTLLFILIISVEPLIGQYYPLGTHLFYVLSCGGLLWWAYRHEIALVNPLRRG